MSLTALQQEVLDLLSKEPQVWTRQEISTARGVKTPHAESWLTRTLVSLLNEEMLLTLPHSAGLFVRTDQMLEHLTVTLDQLEMGTDREEVCLPLEAHIIGAWIRYEITPILHGERAFRRRATAIFLEQQIYAGGVDPWILGRRFDKTILERGTTR